MPSGKFRFGLFTFDVVTRELRREHILVHLQSQPAQVLGCLIERAGQVVSREELRNAVWGSGTFVDFDRGLNFCITQIRSALGDDSAGPTFIQTLPKRGYQFIAPVERIPDPAAEAPAAEPKTVTGKSSGKALVLWLTAAVVVCGVLAFAAKSRFGFGQALKDPPVVAVLRFDNQTSNPDLTLFSDALTDTVVEQLTAQSNGRFSVIGNAQILRLPRDQRDLSTIATTLHASYVVLGQVQANGDQTRVLAHLIRLPEQKHVWVARMDRSLSDQLSVQSEVARKIAAELSPRVTADADHSTSQPSASH